MTEVFSLAPILLYSEHVLIDKILLDMSKKLNDAARRLMEEELYQAVATEIKHNQIREGLMAKALMEASGNEEHARALYIKYRIQSMIDEATLSDAADKIVENEKRASEAKKLKAESARQKAESRRQKAEVRKQAEEEDKKRRQDERRQKAEARKKAQEEAFQFLTSSCYPLSSYLLSLRKKVGAQWRRDKAQFRHIKKVMRPYAECWYEKNTWYLRELKNNSVESFNSLAKLEAAATILYADAQPGNFSVKPALPKKRYIFFRMTEALAIFFILFSLLCIGVAVFHHMNL